MGEISVWVKGHQKQIGGVSHKTTAAAIVSFVLSECVWSPTEKVRRSGRCYALFENWRGCQRLIPPWKRIYKLWKLWGLERIHVRFVVKKVAMETLARKDFGEYVEASQLKVPKRHVARRMEPHAITDDESECTSSSDGLGLYLLNESDVDGDQSPKTRMKRTLLKQVVRQNEQLQDISRTVEDVDEEILFYEAKLHHYRVVEGGKDYVQDTYLAELEKKSTHHQGTSKSSSTVQPDDSKVINDSKDGQKSNVQDSCMTKTMTQNDNNREHVDETAHIDENSRRNPGNKEVILGKKNGAKIVVVNPLPREHIATAEEQNDDEGVKMKDVPRSHQEEKNWSLVCEHKPSFRSTKRMNKHGGRVKKRMPGLYEFEQSCDWLKVMDKELKRLESLENLSFVDWDSESLLSDKELKHCGNRKFKFRNGFSSFHRKPVPETQTKHISADVNEMQDHLPDLGLGKKRHPAVVSAHEKDTQEQTNRCHEENTALGSGLKTVSEGHGEAPTRLTLVNGSEVDNRSTNTPVKESQTYFSESKSIYRKDCASLSKKLVTFIETNEKKKEVSENIKPVESLSENNVKGNHLGDNSFATSSSVCANQHLPQPQPCTILRSNQICQPVGLDKSNQVCANAPSFKFSSPGESKSKGDDRNGNIVNVQSGKEDQLERHSPANVATACQSLGMHGTPSLKVDTYHKTVAGSYPVSEHTKMVKSLNSFDEHLVVENAAKSGIKALRTSVPEPQSSPVSVRKVPNPPIYYPSEDPVPVRHSPTDRKYDYLTRDSSKSTHGGQRHSSVTFSGVRSQKCNVTAALHPRVKQLRTSKLNGQVLSVIAKAPLEGDSGKTDSQLSDVNSPFRDNATSHVDEMAGKTISQAGKKHVYFEDERPQVSKPGSHSTPIKEDFEAITSRVRSPDQGLGQDIPSLADRGKSAENADSGSDTGLSSVHSQDSGISNATVVIETWV